jgi:hypothetical protein
MPGQSATLTGNVFEARPKTAFQFFDPPQGEPVPLTAEPEEAPARRSISPTSSPSIPSSEAELRGRGPAAFGGRCPTQRHSRRRPRDKSTPERAPLHE